MWFQAKHNFALAISNKYVFLDYLKIKQWIKKNIFSFLNLLVHLNLKIQVDVQGDNKRRSKVLDRNFGNSLFGKKRQN